jgi:catechol 2,3-dioxygenase-like lactoylglutathione lyase family enzyme
MDLGKSTIGQVAITVADVTVALEFYRDLLGLPFLKDPDGNMVGLMEEKRPT